MDHVALASRHTWDQVTRYCHQLGGRWLGGPRLEDRPFYFCQAEFAGGTKLELLEPVPGAGSDFLRRFLDRNGPGPHHFTFKVLDFDAALDAVAATGYEVVGVDRDDPEWHEAFLHPKQSHGIVIQLAYEGRNNPGWPEDEELPPSIPSEAPTLASVEHLVSELDSAVKLFAGPLAMTEVERATDHDGEYAVLESGPWRLKLIQPKRETWRHWLGTRPGRLLQLSFLMDEPGTVPGVEPRADGWYELAPEYNLGTRLLLRSREGHG